MRQFTRVLALATMTAVALASPARAHETDQFTLPEGRTFADLGLYLNEWAYRTIEVGVQRVNQRISQSTNRTVTTAQAISIEDADEIIRSVNAAFGNAYSVIEGFEHTLYSKELKQRYPGTVVGYKQQFGNIYQHVHFILDPRQVFRLWHATTLMAYGTYFGTDKIGHFTDMGMNYYREYSAQRKKGASEQDAVAAAVRVGTHGALFSERGMVGYLSAGHYSNADLAANYLGFVFYRNLTEPMMLEGRQQPPMLVREGPYWRIAPHVDADSNFFAMFISDHLDEALNPGLYESGMRDSVHDAISERATRILNRRVDQHGNRRPRSYFLAIHQELQTYYGENYGHEGTTEELVSVAGSCYDSFAADASPAARNRFGKTPLHQAAAMGEAERVMDLIRRGADVNAQVRSNEDYSPEWGNTPLHYAAAEGRAIAVRVLLESGANPGLANDRGQTPLHRALAHPEVVRLLLERGASVDAVTTRDESALHWAAQDGQTESLDLLLNNGAKAQLRSHAGRTPLHCAAMVDQSDSVMKLLTFGSDVNAMDEYGITPLHVAATHGCRTSAEAMINHTANIDSADQFGWTALHAAADSGATEVVELLLARGARVSALTAHQDTPLHLAARNGHPASVNALIKSGANVNAANRIGMTPLHEAVAAGSTNTVSMLLNRGADRTAKNAKGQSPLQMTKVASILALLRTAPIQSGSPTADAREASTSSRGVR